MRRPAPGRTLDAVAWSIDDGDGRLAYTLLKDLGLLNKIQDSLTDPSLLNRQMHLDHLNLLHSLRLPTHDNEPDTPATSLDYSPAH